MAISRAAFALGLPACLGIGWGVARYAAPRVDADRESSAELSAELSKVKRRLARVEQERGRAELSARLHASLMPAAPAAKTALEPATSSETAGSDELVEHEALVDEEARAARTQQQISRRVEVLRRQLSSETRDAGWADDFEARVRNRMQALDPNLFATTRLTSADCRTSLCMMEIVADSAEEARRLPTIMAAIGHRSFVSNQPNSATGGQRWTMFVERPGFSLPKAEDPEL